VIVETEFFKQIDKTTKILIEKEALTYAHFLGKKIEINYNIG